MDIKNVITSALVALLVTVVVVSLLSPHTASSYGTTAVSTGVTEPAGTVLPNGVVLPNPSTSDYTVERVYDAIQSSLGLGNGTSVPTHIQGVRAALTAATSTICALQNPYTATSTIVSSALNITTATSSAGSIIAAVALTPFATTTVIAQGISVPASSLASLVVGETASSTGAGVIVGPSNYIVWGMTPASAVGYGYTYGGTCQAVFETIN